MTEQKQHPEWEKESSLTSPSDRDLENKWRPEQEVPPLTNEETKEAMKIAGKRFGVSVVNFESTTDPDDGAKLLAPILEELPKITAVISLNPGAMVGLLQETNSKGISVPGRLSLLSMATPESFVSATSPRLTTISPPAFEMGDSAARRLIAFLENSDVENLPPQLWSGELVVRETTGPAEA